MTRFIGKGLKNLIPGSPNLNVLNVCRTLLEDCDCFMYIPQNYAAEKRTSSDPKVHFMPIEAGRYMKVVSITSNQERFNFSLTGEVDVMIETDNCDNSENINLINKKVFRTYTIIRDGKLMINYLNIKFINANDEAFEILKSCKILGYNEKMLVPENHMCNTDCVYTLILNKMPVISLAWAQPNNLHFYENLIREAQLANTLKTVNSLIKTYKERHDIYYELASDEYYIEKTQGSDKRIGDKVSVDCVTYHINEKGLIPEYIEPIDLTTAMQMKRTINKELKHIRFFNRCIVVAVESSKNKGNYDWSELKNVPRSKTKKYQTVDVIVNDEPVTLIRTIYSKMF